ncbi:hypothetical protein [Anoxynatronum buryatiense]|uniref:Uncharacterized protein n=1 Tax=Anoxynatronum buryatiense TaxID=489973 RepID=A0AA46AIZ4_9CLOT|nr:hypothetical protein [Anoxynatronum buryatiense]SMP55334.1 hypothetical protein SAMN06296020_105239 [Anoxynatronum buryatiense]
MNKNMKRIISMVVVMGFVIGLLVGGTQVFAEAKVPPGQARKEAVSQLQQQAATQQQEQENENDEKFREYGPGGGLPPGLRGKGTPPGLLKQGFTLPPGLMEKEELPPGIQMRFSETLQWQHHWGPEGEPGEDYTVAEAVSQTTLMQALADEKIDVIKLTEGIVLSEPLVVNREVWLDGNGQALVAGADYDGWMIRVEAAGVLYMKNAVLDGFGEEEEHLAGLIKVAIEGIANFTGNDFRNAPLGILVLVETEEDWNEVDHAAILKYNRFHQVDEPVAYELVP